MTDLVYTGFRFRWERADVSIPGGVLSTHCIVVARSRSEAQSILEETLTGSLVGVSLIKSGPDILAEAQKLRIGEGKAVAL